MIYRAIGLMSGSSLDGLDLVFAEFHENGGHWTFEILASDCYAYPQEWKDRLQNATRLSAMDYQLLHVAYGHYLGQEINRFIEEKSLHYRVALIASHGHTSFHMPAAKMTAQLGDGAAIAAATALPVVSDLRALDLAFGGQGAPIVPIGEKLLFPQHTLFLNLGGIANISINAAGNYTAFDLCPANRVLNLLASQAGKDYDAGGQMAASGQLHQPLLNRLNALEYYERPHPKSLANSFGTDEVLPLILSFGLSHQDALRTYTEHIAVQIRQAIEKARPAPGTSRMLVTGGGAFNNFLVERLAVQLRDLGIEPLVPDPALVNFKEALVMALIGVLRWRQEYTVLASVTGASRNSIGGALWTGQEA